MFHIIMNDKKMGSATDLETAQSLVYDLLIAQGGEILIDEDGKGKYCELWACEQDVPACVLTGKREDIIGEISGP